MPDGLRAPTTLAALPARAAARLARLVGRPPVGPAAAAVGELVGAAVRRWDHRPGSRGRQLRRLSSIPLPNLYSLYPEARKATPREIGLRSVDLDLIAGTAVGGPTQRGSDFLPLPPFRSQNWAGRWQRIRRAVDQLAILPPIDVVRYADRYWVMDGHNRVAAALYVGQVAVDANVTELVPPGANPTERPGDLAAALAGTRSLRAAGQGGRLQSVADDVVLGVLQGTDDGRASAGRRGEHVAGVSARDGRSSAPESRLPAPDEQARGDEPGKPPPGRPGDDAGDAGEAAAAPAPEPPGSS